MLVDQLQCFLENMVCGMDEKKNGIQTNNFLDWEKKTSQVREERSYVSASQHKFDITEKPAFA